MVTRLLVVLVCFSCGILSRRPNSNEHGPGRRPEVNNSGSHRRSTGPGNVQTDFPRSRKPTIPKLSKPKRAMQTRTNCQDGQVRHGLTRKKSFPMRSRRKAGKYREQTAPPAVKPVPNRCLNTSKSLTRNQPVPDHWPMAKNRGKPATPRLQHHSQRASSARLHQILAVSPRFQSTGKAIRCNAVWAARKRPRHQTIHRQPSRSGQRPDERT